MESTTMTCTPFVAVTRGYRASGLSVANRDRTAAVHTTKAAAQSAISLLPISDVVVFDGLAGIRSWSPPV